MAELDPKALVKQLAAAVNAHDCGRIVALFDANSIVQDIAQHQFRSVRGELGPHIPRGIMPRGREAVELYWRYWFDAVPDLRLIPTALTGGEGGAALEFTFQGTHRGEFLGIAPRGHRIGVQAAGIFTFMHGQIHELRLYYDLATLEQQMGGRLVATPAFSAEQEQARQRAEALAQLKGAKR